MLNIDLLNELSKLGNYSISGTDAQAVANKARAQRRINIIKAHVGSNFGGHWDRNWRDGFLGLAAPYSTGTVIFTNGSRTVTGTSTVWTSSMAGSLIQAGVEYYRIASVLSATQLYLTTAFQGTTSSTGITYLIWQDQNRLYPDALVVDDFLNYTDPAQMSESWKANNRSANPAPSQSQVPRLWSMSGNIPLTSSYATGTVSGTINTNILTGNGTAWQANLEPGFELTLTVGTTSYTYRVRTVDSDTQVTLYQLLAATVPAATTYTSVGKNCPQVRFASPTSQQVVSYGYYAKDWPFINDNDSDWMADIYPEVLIMGATYFDYLDKNDTTRSREARLIWSDMIRDVHVAEHMNYTGVRTIGYDIPNDARDQ